ncbi:hypothetical protein B0H63DRAFT_312080 [Podospora didyma]|uniref:GPI anchored protein n=1 Tax=Podospora didyma TaxID=330526 RepID=A0AAE0K5F3_9PEZI|nr:hypothetical protein B0H63DRAFT_312080 [Podospora didyma]
MHILPLSLWLLITAQIEARETQQQQLLPTAIRKMSPDQGAKFFHEYCAFPDLDRFTPAAQEPLAVAARSVFEEDDARRLAANASAEIRYRPPFAPHLDAAEEGDEEEGQRTRAGRWELFRRAAEALALLERRQWACPTGTASCANIGRPNSCCQTGETCMKVTDTGLGDVGCCPAGTACSGGVSVCGSGSTACASEIGGGCCIPGFVCAGVGCVQSSSSSVPAPTPTGVTTITSTSTSVIAGPAPSTVVVTVVVTITPSQAPPATSTTTKVVSISPSTSPSTPVTTTTSTDSDAGAPFRPTSSSPTASGTNTYCPTGFYPCLATAGGGCCQTGRDCQTTSCPPIALTTIINGNGITVVVPASGVPAATTTSCAGGWFLCGSDAGPLPGCCPSGYSCGTASCSSVATAGTATVAKALPGSRAAADRRPAAGTVLLGLLLAVCWISS